MHDLPAYGAGCCLEQSVITPNRGERRGRWQAYGPICAKEWPMQMAPCIPPKLAVVVDHKFRAGAQCHKSIPYWRRSIRNARPALYHSQVSPEGPSTVYAYP